MIAELCPSEAFVHPAGELAAAIAEYPDWLSDAELHALAEALGGEPAEWIAAHRAEGLGALLAAHDPAGVCLTYCLQRWPHFGGALA